MIFLFVRYEDTREKVYDQERQQWQAERKELLDRIQAPSFDHLKQAEVKIIKAQKEPAKEPSTLEVV
jgi:hypothetical protein